MLCAQSADAAPLEPGVAAGRSASALSRARASARQEDWDSKLFRHLFLVDADGGEPVRLTGEDGWHEAPAWSPDGSLIACRFSAGGFDFPRHGQIAVIDGASGARRVLTPSLDRNCAPYPEIREPVWDGGTLLFALEDRGNNHLYRVRADGAGAPEPVVDGELWVTGFDCVGERIVHSATTPASPAELYCGERRLTELTRAFTDGRKLAEPERFTAVSADGAEIEAWLIRPVGFEPGRRYPVLLNIHGGPFTQYGNTFFDEFQVYADAGYVVLYWVNNFVLEGGSSDIGWASKAYVGAHWFEAPDVYHKLSPASYATSITTPP